jgi:hypothetical protein
VGSSELGARGEDALPDHEIHRRDLEWLESCDAVIAEVSTPSLGVGNCRETKQTNSLHL